MRTPSLDPKPSERPIAPKGPAAAASLAECLLVGILAGLVVYLLLPGPYTPGSNGDDGTYLALGKALAQGRGYRSIYAVGAPHHVKFPPLYPALLSIFWRYAGDAYEVVRLARIANAVLLGGTAVLIWLLGRNRLRVARLPLAVFALAPLLLDPMLHYFALPISEPLFLFLWALALVVAVPLQEGPRRSGAAVALGVVLAAAAVTREQGLAFLAAAPFALALGRVDRRRALIVLIVAAVPVVAWELLRTIWIVQGSAAGAEQSYVGDMLGGRAGMTLDGIGSSALFNLRAYPGVLAAYLGPGLAGKIAIGALAGLCLLGTLHLGRRAPLLAMTLVMDALLIALWPYTVDRLLLSALPFAGLAVAYRVDLDRRRVPRLVRRVAGALLLLLAAGVGYWQFDMRRAEASGGPQFYTPARLIDAVSRKTRLISAWVSANTDSSDVIYLTWPEGVYLLTGRLTVNADPAQARTRDASQPVSGPALARDLVAAGVSVVVVSAPGYQSAADVRRVRASCPGLLRPVATLDPTGYPAVFRLRPEASRCAPAAAEPGAAQPAKVDESRASEQN